MVKTIEKVDFISLTRPKFIRVAAYGRVSRNGDAMHHSLSQQISYYSQMIQSHPGWLFCGVFADEAKTGTKDSREQFQKLIAECRAGNIDMVITKSISRFARNTVTLLETVRELKVLGIDIFFEEQNIHTSGTEGELLLTLLASFAQAESESCSENVKWRIRNGFKEGKASPFSMLGYEQKNGEIIRNAAEAELVAEIFDLYRSGYGLYKIANILNEKGDKTKKGNEWRGMAVSRILQNEKYAGDLKLQKYYRDNYINKKKCVNRGELPMYLVENDHEAIVDRKTFMSVQSELERRTNRNPKRGEVTAFTGKITCSGCGKNYRRKTTPTGIVWICTTYNTKGKKYCTISKAIPEETLKSVTAEILGSQQFDENVFSAKVRKIVALPENKLKFCFFDGTERDAEWKDRSRSESWTAEMKIKAREKAKRRIADDGKENDGYPCNEAKDIRTV